MKKTLLTILSLGTLSLGAVLASPSDLRVIEKTETDYFKVNGKYQQIKNSKFEVHEYQASTGNGYQVFYEDANFYYSKGFGVEAEYRTWKRAKIATTTP